jgi:hypothetical protein
MESFLTFYWDNYEVVTNINIKKIHKTRTPANTLSKFLVILFDEKIQVYSLQVNAIIL